MLRLLTHPHFPSYPLLSPTLLPHSIPRSSQDGFIIMGPRLKYPTKPRSKTQLQPIHSTTPQTPQRLSNIHQAPLPPLPLPQNPSLPTPHNAHKLLPAIPSHPPSSSLSSFQTTTSNSRIPLDKAPIISLEHTGLKTKVRGRKEYITATVSPASISNGMGIKYNL